MESRKLIFRAIIPYLTYGESGSTAASDRAALKELAPTCADRGHWGTMMSRFLWGSGTRSLPWSVSARKAGWRWLRQGSAALLIGFVKGHDTRALQAYLGHRNIQHTVRYTELSPTRFKDFWRD